MRFAEAVAIIERITYRPGWELRLRQVNDLALFAGDEWWPLTLEVLARVEDTRGSGLKVVAHNHRLPPPDALRGRDDLLGVVLQIVQLVEAHEAAEWLRFDGEIVFDPHAEGHRYDGHPARR